MKTDLSQLMPGLYGRIAGVFRRFHLIIFACLAFVIISISVALLYSAADTSGPGANENNAVTTSFDQQTIDKIRNLNKDSSSKLELPNGRVSPFQ